MDIYDPQKLIYSSQFCFYKELGNNHLNDTRAATEAFSRKKSGFVKSGKLSDISRDGPAQSLVREKLKKLLTTNQKMEAYINNVMLSETALVKDF